ncbi:MAG: hypothetical protein IJW29_06535 [Clostridia bacterium]|nr:hypothetical protein [Clostridia bacterium]
MNYQDVIQGFRNYTPAHAEQLKDAWKLSMPTDLLLFCINHYRTQERRDPHVDELYMLDRLSSIQEGSIGALAPTDLFTNDDFVAETYADLIKKRREVNPYATYPCTLTEAARIANAYLYRVGKTVSASAFSAVPEVIDDSSTSPSASCITAGNAPFRLRLLPTSGEPMQVGDRLLLLSQARDESRVHFGKAIEELLGNAALKKHVKGVYTVRDSGILHELLELFGSVRVYLHAFSAWNETVPMTVLTHQHGASRILRVSQKDLPTVLSVLNECGMKATVFAEITGGGHFEFLRTENTAPITLNAQFMRLLFHYKALEARLSDEYACEAAPIDARVVCDLSCRYLEPARVCSDAHLVADTLCAAASAAPDGAFFKTALYTALAPVLTLAACGMEYTKQSFSVGLLLPAECRAPQSAGEVLSAILGIYRAQTELALFAEGLAIHTDPNAEHPSVTAFATGSGSPISAILSAGGHYVYCLSPAFRESGLPDFRTLRTMLDRLTALAQNGTVKSAHVLCNESITDGLRRMSGDVGCRLTDLRAASEGALPIGVLIETDKPLAYRELGMTEVRTDAVETETDADIPDSLIWSETPEVVILAKKTDGDARVLASVFAERGACVHLFFGNTDDCEPLSRALLGAQTLILCDVPLPSDARVTFAFETMKKAGGLLIDLGACAPTDSARFSFPHGIPEAILNKICPAEKKI